MMLLLGDSNHGGKWFLNSYIDCNFNGLPPDEVVYKDSINCYTTLQNLFNDAGYENILMAVGDHKLGDNGWFAANTDKTEVLDQFH